MENTRTYKKTIGIYMIFYDFYKIFLIQLKDFPATIFLTASPKIISKPISPITGCDPLSAVNKSSLLTAKLPFLKYFHTALRRL